jgi:carotenoid cleavage dioxygenase-like enzyme
MSEQSNLFKTPEPLLPEDNPVLQGNYRPVDEELTLSELEVIGEIPADLSGTLLRDGPNPVDPGPDHHWFRGDGMLHAIKFADGKALSYLNRWVRTEVIEEKLGFKAAPVSDIKLPVQGSGSVHVVSHGGRILALPEVGLPYEVDADANTKRQFDFNGRLSSNMTAHPKIDGKTGEMIFFGYERVAPFLRYHRCKATGELDSTVEIELPEAVMMHDFGATATRVIFMDLPVVTQGFDKPFIWSDSHQARLGVMDRYSTTDTVVWIDIDPCYVFHPLNSYDEGDKIVMDVVRFQKTFTAFNDNDYDKRSQLVRWTIDTDSRSVESQVLSDIDQDFPRVNPQYECHKHRFGYSVQHGGKNNYSALLKFDLELGTTEIHSVGENNAPCEPVFVSAGDNEDAGYIISVVYNDETETSEVHIIDAQKFSSEPLAIVKLNARVPFGFHGNFFPALLETVG